jgi:hypothetical protein
MILLRFLSLLVGGLVLILPPLFLFQGTAPQLAGNGLFAGFVALALVSAGFFLIGFKGYSMKRSLALRVAAGVLLALPSVGATWVLVGAKAADLLWPSGMLLCFTILVFITFVYPAPRESKHRPMRPREQ